MAVALEAALAALGDWYALGRLERLGWLLAVVGGGATVYFGACFVTGLRASEFRVRLKV